MSDFVRRMQQMAQARRGITELPGMPRVPRPPTVDPLTSNATNRLRERLGLAPLAVTESATQGASEALEAPGPVMGALRRVASALEPLALPQDAFFAVLAGAVDPETTISQRLSRVHLKDYLPGGEAPERPATGEEILSLMGFDERVAKWGGIGADLLVDPLVFGSWLRVGGKLAKVDELVRLGDRVDTFVSPLGMARETNKLLRRSATISAWQDARMERVMTALRDPNSVVFGIQRFGERTTNLLSGVLPRDTMLRLRFGEEAGRQLLRAEQQARESGMKLSREMMTLIQRIQHGTGEGSNTIVQRVVQAMEGQSAAWERHLSSITDPLEREFIETAVYTLAAKQADPDVIQRASALTELTPERVPDDAVSNFLAEATESLGRFEDFGFDETTARRLGYDDGQLGQRVVETAREAIEPEKEVFRERLRRYVGDRARREGLSEERIVQEQRRAVHVFEEYLAETTRIDATIGMHLTGLPYISERLRARVIELTGDFELADRLYKRILNAGLTRGRAGLDELMPESTGILLDDVADAMLADTAKRFERQRVMYTAAEDLLERLRRADEVFSQRIDAVKEQRKLDQVLYRRNRERLTRLQTVSEEQWQARFASIADGRRSVLLNGIDDLEEYAHIYTSRMRDFFGQIENYTTPGGSELRGIKRRLIHNITGMEKLLGNYSAAIAKVATAPPSRLSRNLLSSVLAEERRLIKAFRQQASLYDEVIDKLGVKPRPTPVRTVATTVEEVAGEAPKRLTPAVRNMLDALASDPRAHIVATGGKARVMAGDRELWSGAMRTAERAADEGLVTGFLGSATSGARDDFVSITDLGRRSLSGETPTTVRAVREVGREARGPSVTARGAAAADPDLAEELFQGPADLYDELNRLRSMADEIRLDLEDALTAKSSLPTEVELPASQFAEMSRRLRSEVAEHKRTIKATAAETRAARAEQQAAIRTERDMWRAFEAAEAGVRRAGGQTHLRNVMAEAKREFGPIGRADPTDPIASSGYNTTKEDILAARAFNADRRMAAGEVLDPIDVQDAPVTFEELLGGIADMQALDLGEFLEGVMNGHLRRAFGLFIDENGFNRYLDKLRGGGIITSNVLDEDDLLGGLTGFEREADLIREYHNALKAAGGGKVLRRDGIVEYLVSRGVDNGRINQTMVALTKAVTSSERHKSNIDALADHIGRYTANQARIQAGTLNPRADPRQALTVRNQVLFEEQRKLNKHMLELLGEYALTSMSLLEGVQVANRVLPRQRYFEEVLKVATDRGLVKGGKFTDNYGAVYRKVDATDNAIGGFGGRYVHPYLYTELQRMAAVRKPLLPPAFTRLRSLITGGYLASPAVLAANVAGGFYQSATAGFNPAVIARRMLEVYPELRKTARGEWSDLIEEVNRNLPIDLTTLIGNIDTEDVARLIRIQAGVGPEGIRGFLDNAAHQWERFLQKPFGMRFAGLEGFQFTENWFKVAAYKEMKERVLREGIPGPNGQRIKVGELRAQEIAAEAARTVVFDYSTLPTSLEGLKRTGLVLFPGFPFYIAGRTVAAALERPGTVALADRMAEAFANMALPIEDQVALFMGTPEWLRTEQGVPLPGITTSRDDGNRQVSVIPFAQLVPTVTIWDSVLTGDLSGAAHNPWVESITQLGMWGPLYDIISAIATGEGEAPINGRFGHVVFEPGSSGPEKVGEIFRFLYNTMAPSAVRKGLSIDYQDRAQGLVPSLIRAVMNGTATSPDDLLAGVYSVEERRTGRPDKTWKEGVISYFLRSPQVIALDGPLAGIRNEMGNERTQLNDQLSSLRQRYNRARAAGQTATAEVLLERMNLGRQEFNEKWREYLEFYNAYAQRRRQQQP